MPHKVGVPEDEHSHELSLLRNAFLKLATLVEV
jgi:hypothetical protein